jgi:hypothetical protein
MEFLVSFSDLKSSLNSIYFFSTLVTHTSRPNFLDAVHNEPMTITPPPPIIIAVTRREGSQTIMKNASTRTLVRIRSRDCSFRSKHDTSIHIQIRGKAVPVFKHYIMKTYGGVEV